MVVDVGGYEVGKWFKKFRGLQAPVKYWRGRTTGAVGVHGRHGEVLCFGRGILGVGEVGEP